MDETLPPSDGTTPEQAPPLIFELHPVPPPLPENVTRLSDVAAQRDAIAQQRAAQGHGVMAQPGYALTAAQIRVAALEAAIRTTPQGGTSSVALIEAATAIENWLLR